MNSPIRFWGTFEQVWNAHSIPGPDILETLPLGASESQVQPAPEASTPEVLRKKTLRLGECSPGESQPKVEGAAQEEQLVDAAGDVAMPCKDSKSNKDICPTFGSKESC